MSDSITPVAIPKWGIEMVEGTLNRWLVAEGDSVAQGDDLVEVESDKIVNVLEAPGSGVLRRILVPEGSAGQVAQLVAVIAEADVADADIEAFVAGYAAPAAADEEGDNGAGVNKTDSPTAQSGADAGASPQPALAPTDGKAVRVSPPVRRLAKKLGVDLAGVTGSGANGRITTADVEQAAAGTAPEGHSPSGPSTAADYRVVTLPAARQTAARRLVAAKQDIPHFYLTTELAMDRALAARAQFNEGRNARASVNDILLLCAARALAQVPEVNAHLVDGELRVFDQPQICMAVDTPTGLMTPVIPNAAGLSLEQIAAASARLAAAARDGKLTHSDVEGGTFTVSNLGMYGVRQFSAIINPPQVAILALGEATRRARVQGDGQVVPANTLEATLSCDHRVVDGALGGRFLQAFRQAVEDFSS